MSDRHDGRFGQRLLQHEIDLGLGRLIERRGCLVEQEPVGFSQERAGDRQTLLLAERQGLRPGALLIELLDERRELRGGSASSIAASP